MVQNIENSSEQNSGFAAVLFMVCGCFYRDNNMVKILLFLLFQLVWAQKVGVS